MVQDAWVLKSLLIYTLHRLLPIVVITKLTMFTNDFDTMSTNRIHSITPIFHTLHTQQDITVLTGPWFRWTVPRATFARARNSSRPLATVRRATSVPLKPYYLGLRTRRPVAFVLPVSTASRPAVKVKVVRPARSSMSPEPPT